MINNQNNSFTQASLMDDPSSPLGRAVGRPAVRDGVLSLHILIKHSDVFNRFRWFNRLRTHIPRVTVARLADPSNSVLELQISSSRPYAGWHQDEDMGPTPKRVDVTLRALATLTFQALFHAVVAIAGDGEPSGRCHRYSWENVG